MERIWIQNWPEGIPRELHYLRGEKPLFEYLRANAREFPDKAAYIYYGREISWKEMDKYSDRLASFLAKKGISTGDRVALFLQNCPQYVIPTSLPRNSGPS